MTSEDKNQAQVSELLEKIKLLNKQGKWEEEADLILEVVPLLLSKDENSHQEEEPHQTASQLLARAIKNYMGLELRKKAENAALLAKKHQLIAESKELHSVIHNLELKYHPEPELPPQFVEIQSLIQQAENLNNPESWAKCGKKYLDAAHLVLKVAQNPVVMSGAAQYATEALSKFLSVMSTKDIEKTIQFIEIHELAQYSEALRRVLKVAPRFLP